VGFYFSVEYWFRVMDLDVLVQSYIYLDVDFISVWSTGSELWTLMGMV
jgi:hypothetical protein